MPRIAGVSTSAESIAKKRLILAALSERAMSIADIADITGLGIGAVHTHLRVLVPNNVEKIKIPNTARNKRNYIFKVINPDYEPKRHSEILIKKKEATFFNPFRMAAPIFTASGQGAKV
jgi:predicted ArsR family transcriptional regulator